MRNQILILTICLLSSLVLRAQDNYRAVHWDLQDGLSQAETFHMIKDVNGFLWIGTRGELSRFDGSTFKNFYYDPTKKGTINAKFSGGGLVEDSLHNIWIGTDKGLYRYDIKADVFSQFLPDAGADAPILIIYPLLATKDSLFCLESDTIITAYDVNTLQKKKLVSLLRTDEIGNGLSSSYAHYDAASRSMWMLKGARGRPGGGLLRVSLSTGEKKFFGWSCFRNIKDHCHEAEAMCYDHKRNCLWLNSGEGLMQFTLDDNQFHHIDPLNNLLDVKESHHFVGVALDHQDRVWVATAQKGIVIYNPHDHSVTFPFKKGSDIQNEVSHANAKIYIDRDGIIWSGFWLRKGIYQIIPYSPSIRRYKQDLARKDGLNIANVINFENAGQGKLLIGSFDGLHVFDSRANSFQALREKELPGYRGSLTVPLAVDSVARKAILLSPPKDLFSLDLETRKCTQLILRDSAGQKIENYNMVRAGRHKDEFIITSLIEDRQKIFTLKTDSVAAHEIFSIPTDPFADLENLGLTLVENFMFLKRPRARNLTFTFRNHKWIQSPSPLDSLNWTHIAYNQKDQSFWAVIEKQLVKFDMDFKTQKTYTPKAGLPDIEIYNIIADSRGNIWFNTDRSIHQLNVGTGVVSALTEKDGFEPQGFTKGPPMTMASDGDLYLGGGVFGEGFVRITPEKYTNTASVIYLKSLEINQQPLQLSIGVNNLQELSLKHFENKISLETAAIDYYSKGKGHIRYKLQGVNDDWEYEPAGYTIRYDGLLPGKYTLLMQASNAANEFIGPIKSLSIIISPPWWRAWWAYVAYTVMFASLVWGFIYYRSRELRRRNIMLEEKVLQRTNDLNRSLQELKQTQNQLIQSEKMASLGELTAGIAHEIQNPLNFVNNFSEVSNELLEEMKEQIDKGNYKEVKTLSDDVIQNLAKILHHGKRADGIVKGMLQHSRNSSGVKEATNINTLADEYLRLAYHGLRAKDKSFNVTIQTHFQEDIGTINIIPQDIGRVILNLITNAFYAVKLRKQQEPGIEPTIIVRTKREGGKVLISVKDNGTGIPEKVLEKIFQPFFTTKPVGQGTGLGLSLSYDIIKAHNGELKVITKEGEGSEFLITLP